MKVLVGPHVSEKGTMLADKHNQVVFKVIPDATKLEVKKAVENLFKVEVNNVQVVNVRGKMKRTGQNWGKRKNWKKAYVSLKEGQDIDFIGAE
jgi:large subunit ribosomal protein L23